MTRDKPDRQRALVLQGGRALGAYEVGVIKELCTRLMEKHKDKENKPLFDIVAGTSIGATNAAILVSNVVKKIKHGIKHQKILKGFGKTA
ncbi:MAG: patatin-like phospholipase family protein [Nitrososphaeraceae archaeon]